MNASSNRSVALEGAPFQIGQAVKLIEAAFHYPAGSVAFVTSCWFDDRHGWRVTLKGFNFSDLSVQAYHVERIG